MTTSTTCSCSCAARAGALLAYTDKLSSYEQEEILEYKHVWFCGPEAKKIDQVRGLNLKSSTQQSQAGASGSGAGANANAVNFGFDDENGYYIMVCLRLCALCFCSNLMCCRLSARTVLVQ